MKKQRKEERKKERKEERKRERKDGRKEERKKEEFNRKYSGFILLFSAHLHISLISVLTIESNCTEFCLHWRWVLSVPFLYVQFF